MKKTGTITYHSTRNCGALLQAYALQKNLQKLGFDNEIIDYRCEKIENQYKLKKLYEIRSAKELVKWVLTIRKNTQSQKKFDHFKKKYLKISKPYNKKTISEAKECYDTFITGSDQVWNFSLNGNDYAYLLDFAEGKKKISYSASMGSSSLQNTNEEEIKDKLSSFHAISAREEALNDLINEKFKLNSQMVLDPTLLLSKEDYDFICNLKNKGDYIFVYTVASTPNIEKAVKKFAKETGYKIIWGHMSYRRKKGVINKTDISPDEFVEYIKNAKYVFTSSFHGMALSIALEKQFFYDLDIKKGNNNSRLETLSELLELRGRELKGENENLLNKEPINYEKVNSLLKEKREKSIEFLKTNV